MTKLETRPHFQFPLNIGWTFLLFQLVLHKSIFKFILCYNVLSELFPLSEFVNTDGTI